jgi:hypothetical protein
MTLGRVAILMGCALGVVAAGVVITVLYMVLYGHLINPGHDKAYYDAHVQVAGPYIGIVAGIPLVFFAGLLVGRFWSADLAVPAALIMWLTYAVIDVGGAVAWGLTPRIIAVVAVSVLTKLAAADAGGLVASWRVA